METTIITIDSNEIESKLLAESGYTARSRSALGMPDEVARNMLMTGDEKRIIGNWIRSAVNEAAHIIGQHFGSCTAKQHTTAEGCSYRITFSQPHNYPEDAVQQISDCVTELVTAIVQQRWSMTVKPDEASIPALRVQQMLSMMKRLLTMRQRPSKERGPSENVIEL